MIKKIISFSLWGDNPRYTLGMVENAKLARQIYPDWICRVYIHPHSVGTDVQDALFDLGCQTVWMPTISGGMFWRFLAADSDDTVIFRDSDSRLSYREKMAVDEWVNSSYNFHIMRDHPYHSAHIMGGMWGCRSGVLKGVTKQIEEWPQKDRWQDDQQFLAKVVYPAIKGMELTHDEFYVKKPFPFSKRHPKFFVGQAYGGDGKILDDDGDFNDYIKEEYDYFRQCYGAK